MVTPQELEVWYIIPSIRKELAKVMKTKGLAQKEIARKLDITEAAVSQYLKLKRAKDLVFTGPILQEIEKSAIRIIESNNEFTAMDELQRLCAIIRKKQILCQVHKKHTGKALKKCEACTK